MKTKNLSKKLTLNKVTVSTLNNSELNSIRGAGSSLPIIVCPCLPPTLFLTLLPTCLTCLCTHLADCKGETIVDCPPQS